MLASCNGVPDGVQPVSGFDLDRYLGTWYEIARLGRLKVSFFGPFYGGYNIFALDDAGYQYAMVAGPDRSYLWILARTPDVESSLVEDLVARAAALDFPVEELIFVEHGAHPGKHNGSS